MQQGNLFNNLLNLNPATAQGKSTPKPQINPVSDERRDFQAVMAQARPEVADSRPVTKPRKNPDNPAPEKTQQAHKPAVGKHEAEPSAASKRQTSASRLEKSETSEELQGDKQPLPTEKVATSVSTEDKTEGSQPETTDVVDETLVITLATSLSSPEPEAEHEETVSGLSLDLSSVAGLAIDESNTEIKIDTEISAEENVSPLLLDGEGSEINSSPTATNNLVDMALITSVPDEAGTINPQTLGKGDTAGVLVSSGIQAPLLAGRSAFALEQSTANAINQDVSLPDNILVQDSDAENVTLDLDIPANASNLKQTLLKSGENLLIPQEKAALTEAAKPAAPTVTSLVDALGRPLDNSLASTRSFMAQINLPQTMGHPQWNQAMGERVLWMAAQNLTAADIRLDPPELGSMQVKVTIQQDQATVSFVSPHPVVREALDQQATRLREMFAEQGLNLVHVDVSDRHAQERESADEESSSRSNTQDEEEGLQVLGQSQPANLRLIDHYA